MSSVTSFGWPTRGELHEIMTERSVIVWDLETVPDIAGFAAANGHEGKSDDEIRAAMGDKFPKHIYHSIICIGALVAHQEDGRWSSMRSVPRMSGSASRRRVISSFVDRIAELSPQLITFNGSSFDLPVLRYRAMVHRVAAPGLSLRPDFNRYTEDAVDLCDLLSSFSYQGDVVNTYRVWLRYELFRGRLSDAGFQASEVCLVEFMKARGNAKPYLVELM